MKSSKHKIISALIALVIIASIFVWYLFNVWGLIFFQVSFQFSRMILPFLVMFFVIWLAVHLILSAIRTRIMYSKMTDEEKQQHNEALQAKIAESKAKQRELVEKRQAERKEEEQRNRQALEELAANPAVPRCAKCGSESITANKKGYGVGKAIVGTAVAGPVGLVAGNIGAKKVRITCLNCGHSWIAGKG